MQYFYVRRKDDHNVITGQMGYSDFTGQFDDVIYEQVNGKPPEGATVELKPEQIAAHKASQMSAAFGSGYAPLATSLSPAERRTIMSMHREIQDSMKVFDLDVPALVLNEFDPSALSGDQATKDAAEALKQNLLTILGA